MSIYVVGPEKVIERQGQITSHTGLVDPDTLPFRRIRAWERLKWKNSRKKERKRKLA